MDYTHLKESSLMRSGLELSHSINLQFFFFFFLNLGGGDGGEVLFAEIGPGNHEFLRSNFAEPTLAPF